MTIRWPATGGPHVDPRPGAATAPPTHDLWPRLVARFAPYQGAWERGLSEAAASTRALQETLPRVLCGSEPVLIADEQAAVAAALGVVRNAALGYDRAEWEEGERLADSLIAWWAQRQGLGFAVEAAIRAGFLRVERRTPNPPPALPPGLNAADSYRASVSAWLVDTPGAPCTASVAWLRALRRAVAATTDSASLTAGRATAERLRAAAPRTPPAGQWSPYATVRWMLSYAFRDPDWVRADIDERKTGRGWLDASAHCLLGGVADAGALLALAHITVESHGHGPALAYLPTALDTIGADVVPALVLLLESASGKDLRRGYAELVACAETEPAARALAQCLGDKDTRAIAARYFARVPALARQVLPDFTQGDGAWVDGARSVLASVSAAPVAAAAQDEAAPGDVHPFLADPPWLRKGRAKPPRVLTGLVPLPFPSHVEWRFPGERERQLPQLPGPEVPWRAAQDAEIARRKTAGEPLHVWHLPYLPDPEAIALWNSGLALPDSSAEACVLQILARGDVAVLPGILTQAQSRLSDIMGALSRIVAPEVARHFAGALVRLKSRRGIAQEWLVGHPEAAAVGLVPDAVGPAGIARHAAGVALRRIAEAGGREVVTEVAARYGAEVAAVVEQILAASGLEDVPARLPKRPEWWNPAALPRPCLTSSGQPLSLLALERVVDMLAFSPADPPYPGLSLVRAACTEESLDAFVWGLFDAWQVNGAAAKEQWAFLALGHLGSDRIAERLTPVLRRWPSEGAHGRAVIGLDVLSAMGSDPALRLLFSLSQKAKKGLREKAADKIQEVARARGLTRDDLADRLVDDLELDPDGRCALEQGGQRFWVGFDEQLGPSILDAGGRRLKDLPKPTTADDKAAAERWKDIKKDARRIGGEQRRRLERALASRRRWAAADFRSAVAGHPLVGHLVRRLLWGTYDGENRLVAAFRFAEDRTLAGIDDGVFALGSDALVGLVHPLDLDAAGLATWGARFAEYAVIQPFAQLGRDVHQPTDAERGAATFARTEGRKTTFGRLLGLESHGWERGEPWGYPPDGPCVGEWVKPLAGALVARLRVTPALVLTHVEPGAVATLSAVELAWGRVPADVTLGSLHPVHFSELARDLLGL